MIYTAADGTQIDLTSGQIVGQGKSEVVTPKEATQQKLEQYPGDFGRTAMDALQQGSWTLNSALFAMPDYVIKEVGKARGVAEEDIPTFTKFFNRGEVAPKNAVERYARAIGTGLGTALPMTGIFGAIAKTKALTGPLSPDSAITKQIAKETLDFIRKNPKAAVALDLGFGGAFGAAEQAVEETTTPGVPQDILKATVPFAAVAGVPLAANKLIGLALKLSPTAFAVRKAKEQLGGLEGRVIPTEDVARAVRDTTLNIPLIKGPMNFIGDIYGSFAAKDISKKIGQALDVIGENPTQTQLKLTEDILKFASENGFDGRFTFNLAESTLNPYIRQAYDDAIKKGVTPGLFKTLSQRNTDRDNAFIELITKLTPESQLGLQEALVLNSAERTKAIDDILKKIQGLEEAERNRISDAFDKETSLADIGNSLRVNIFAGREALISRFRTKADELTARPFGVRAATRVEGLPIEVIPSIPFQNFAVGFTNKYNLTPDNRWFGGEVPGPAKDIMRIMSRVKRQQDEALPKALSELVDKRLTEKNPLYRAESPENRKNMVDTAVNAILRGVPGMDTSVEKAMLKQAEDIAAKYADVQITLPESLDLLVNAQRFRSYMFSKGQNDVRFGATSIDADQTKRLGEQVLKDVEDFIFGAKGWKGFSDVPGIKEAKEIYRDSFDNGFDKLFPMLITRRKPSGDFEMNDETIANEALRSRENLRSLNALFGNGPNYTAALQNAILLKAQKAGVFKDGLFDERAFTRFLRDNKSVIAELPDSVQAVLRDELKMGQAFAEQKAALLAEKQAMQDLQLDKIVKEVIRPDADPAELVKNALSRPADMRKLVDTVGKDPEKLQALKRGVWQDMVSKMLDPDDPILLANFKKKYGKALNILYPTQAEQRNLDMVANLQERILAVARPQGDRSPFKTFEEKLREFVGAGVGTLESTARAAAIRIISPIHAGVSLLTRFVARQQQGVAERILLNALVDDKYAKEFIDASSSIETPKGFKQASNLVYKVGGFLPYLIRNVPTTAVLTTDEFAAQEALPYSRAPEYTAPTQAAPPQAAPGVPGMPAPARPPVPRMPEQRRAPMTPAEELMQTLRRGAAAPASSPSLSQSAPGRAVPAMPTQGGPNYQMYQTLFPNDPLAPLMQARQQQPPVQ